MSFFTRRQFVQRSSLLAAAATLGSACSDNSDNNGNSGALAVVIGSGFAGSVAALRLGQAGVRTIVLERGQQWTVSGTNTFPTIASPDRRTTWFGERDALVGSTPITPWAGLIERVQGDTLDALCGACVGGGSLVYGGVLIQPERDIFTSAFPQINYDDMDQLYYPRVLQQIGAGRIPDDILASANYIAQRAFIRDATAAGFDVSKPFTGFDWDIIRKEMSGETAAAASISEYVYGCNSGAKLSTDKNYLRDATATGQVDIRSLTEVIEIRERSGDGYDVECRTIDAAGRELERYVIEATHVFLAAGSLNSSKLLQKSQHSGGLSAANAHVGQGWGTNGDQLMLEISKSPVGGAQGGPACIAARDITASNYPVTFMHSPANVPSDIQIQLAMSVPNTLGELRYIPDSDQVRIYWPDDSETGSAIAREDSFARLLAQTGGSDISGADGKQTIWHPLGGALMGEACDHEGRLYGYKNLFVIDGSLLPGSAATVNPALTIAANAERIMERLAPEVRDA